MPAVPAVFGVWAPILVELAQPRPGDRIVDVACGAGIVARIAAARVGPTGALVGVDLNPGMLSVARSVVSTDSLSGAPLQWQEASADKLPFPDGSFDIVYCQLGLQFFADRAAALREMRRVLGAEGRLALMVWRGIHESPGFAMLAEALERHVGKAAATIMRAPFGLSNAEVSRTASLACDSGPANGEPTSQANADRLSAADSRWLQNQFRAGPADGPSLP